MEKIKVVLDASKISPLVANRTYQNKNGETVTVQEVSFELIELKEPKQIFKNDTRTVNKTHFAVAIQTKEERAAKADTVYVGEGFTTIWGSGDKKTEPKVETTQEPPF